MRNIMCGLFKLPITMLIPLEYQFSKRFPLIFKIATISGIPEAIGLDEADQDQNVYHGVPTDPNRWPKGAQFWCSYFQVPHNEDLKLSSGT